MRPYLALVLVSLFLASSSATASAPVDLAASTTCPPAPGGSSCVVTQEGTIAVVCQPGRQCDLVATGIARAEDAAPLKSVSTRMQVGGVGSASSGCTGIGFGPRECAFMLNFPLFMHEGGCLDVRVGTSYSRTPFSGASVERAFEVCLLQGAHVITPL